MDLVLTDLRMPGADGMAVLYENLISQNAHVVGFVDSEGYDFTDSEAVNEDGLFCGLAIDEDNEYDLTEERLEKWILLLKPEFDF